MSEPTFPGGILAKPKYKFQKRQKELEKQKKKEEKAQRKLERKSEGDEISGVASAESEAPTALEEERQGKPSEG
jgi:hypothetical protein